MRQIWIEKFGGPEELRLRKAPDPQPSPGEMRVRVEASGVNFAYIMGRMGLYPDLPKTPVVPGYEVAGRIDAVGEAVGQDWVGRDVVALTRFGGYSDVVCVPQAQIFARPAGMSALVAAALPVNGVTAWQLVVVMGGLRKGDTILIHSAGGGVGIIATQIAKHIGARIIGTASRAKHDALRALGVDELIDYTRENFETRVREITGGRGVELVLDAVGGDSFKKSYRCLAPSGRLGVFGASSLAAGRTRSVGAAFKFVTQTPWLQFNPLKLMNENKGVFGVNVGHLWGETDRVAGWMKEILGLAAQGVIQPQIARTFRFDEAAAAHALLQERRNLGKALLIP